jgi:hypothetical protein
LLQVKWVPGTDNLIVASDYNGFISMWDLRSSVPLGKKEMHSGKALALDCNMKVDEPMCSVISGGSDCCLKKMAIQK